VRAAASNSYPNHRASLLTRSATSYTERNFPACVAALALADVEHYAHKSLAYGRLKEALQRFQTGETVWMLGLGP